MDAKDYSQQPYEQQPYGQPNYDQPSHAQPPYAQGDKGHPEWFNDSGAWAVLIVISLIAGCIVSWFVCAPTQSPLLEAALAPVFSIVYSILGALLVAACGAFRKWANQGEVKALNKEQKILLGAIWPLYLLFSLIIYSFLAIINRIY
jgi:hypothetical protein